MCLIASPVRCARIIASYSLLANPDSYRDSRTFYLPAGRQVCDLFANFNA